MKIVHLLSAVVMPVDGLYEVKTITDEQARIAVFNADITSHVEDVPTERICKGLIGPCTSYAHEPWDGRGLALVLLLKDKPQDRELTHEEIMEIDHEWRLVRRFALCETDPRQRFI